ncbi:hypothetical protein CkaCkLH20_10049 [Colletotrichum karsti]|uniref:Xylose isomerase-like TIM barrel domain-containing protein n=1 Tax=Colletotrichum karsti TaxID=1095194 RepID=A0A9P6LHG8_9PEZI|nr:uncharacterized protein CkaCkLH20_10049 [Colletotrichum karsti]KAF9872552.1 hypothetical protein CkaCkLH20_10049 [Colletotrichum karsti]
MFTTIFLEADIMTNITRFRTLWGIPPGANFATWRGLFPELKAKGYTGVEIDYRAVKTEDLPGLRKLLEDNGLQLIAQIMSSWPGYEGPRPPGLTPKDHLDFYRKQLERAQVLNPVKVNAQSGSDIWTPDESVEFYQGTFKIDDELGFNGRVTHETHRNRSLYHPYVAKYVLDRVPNLRITADISHWVVVGERLLDVSEEDRDLLEKVIPHVHHIHARIGTTQSSQCPDPSNPVYTEEREFFERLWIKIVQNAIKTQMKITATLCLVVSYVGLATAATGCQVELLNINQAVVGSGCVPFNYYASIRDSTRGAGYTVNANNNCGLSFSGSQKIPDGYSLRRVGYC